MILLAVSLFQSVLLVAVMVLFCGSIWALVKGWAGRKEGLIWAAVWLAAAVAVLWPEVTSRVARALGIGRGADLILYCAVVIMLVGFWSIYIRLRHVRRDVTLLVRHLAQQEAEQQLARTDRPEKTAAAEQASPPSAAPSPDKR